MCTGGSRPVKLTTAQVATCDLVLLSPIRPADRQPWGWLVLLFCKHPDFPITRVYRVQESGKNGVQGEEDMGVPCASCVRSEHRCSQARLTSRSSFSLVFLRPRWPGSQGLTVCVQRAFPIFLYTWDRS